MAQKTLEKRALKAQVRKAVKGYVKQGMTTAKIAERVSTEYSVSKGYVKNVGCFKRV